MYLASLRCNDGLHYVIRETYSDNGYLKSRDLYDLGTDPTKYIEYPGGNGFYYTPDLEEALKSAGAIYASEDLDELFMPFLDPGIRRILEMFSGGGRTTENHWKRYNPEELLRKQKELHSFDLRRLHFLRCGRIDIGDFGDRALGFANVLLDKSRDEIECTIQRMESRLRPHEIRPYLYGAFNLQSYFHGHLLRNHPGALDAEKVDGYFLEEICNLNSSSIFFRGVSGHNRGDLHPYLSKYVILYFDNSFGPGNSWNQYIGEYARREGSRRSALTQSYMPGLKALEVMGISPKELDGMTRKDLTRIYRSKAKELHPDKGGSHDEFVKLTEAYERLLLRR